MLKLQVFLIKLVLNMVIIRSQSVRYKITDKKSNNNNNKIIVITMQNMFEEELRLLKPALKK